MSLRFLTLLAVATAAAVANVNVGVQPGPVAPAVPGKLVDIGGRRLHLNCTGTGSPTVVVENGGGAFSIDWALVQPAVSQFTRICTYDRASYAWSDPGPLRDLPEQTIADFELLLRLGDVQAPYVFVGQSIGGILVRDYQRRIPERTAGLVLVDPTHDEGLAYIIDGKPKPVPLVTREELQDFMKTLMAKNAAAPRLPEKVSAPFDRLPAELQTVRLWAEREYALDQDRQRTPFLGEAQRQQLIALRALRRSESHPLGNLPLVVVTNGVNKQKAELSELSSSGSAVVAENSCHEVHVCTPNVVIDAIRTVVRAAQQR